MTLFRTLLFLKSGSAADADKTDEDDVDVDGPTTQESFELSSQLNTAASITPPGLPGIDSYLRFRGISLVLDCSRISL